MHDSEVTLNRLDEVTFISDAVHICDQLAVDTSRAGITAYY